ncbi:MAG: Ig-like domain-containing protein [Candidatus Eisenbacteria bacterium]|nr:Ig-like domain-containing protein [Candidatus Eisenbacteria bacterium]
MNRIRAFALAAALALAAVAAGAGAARAVALTVGSGSGLAGQTVDIDINTASLTGLNVLSAQMSLSYNNTLVTAIDVIPAGTLVGTAGWGQPTFAVTNVNSTGKISISGAGTTALSGAGAVFRVRFLINPAQLNSTATGLTLSSPLFNEGSPPITFTNGALTINTTPQIDVNPDAGEVIRGQTLQFNTSGSVSLPMSWQTSNAAIATINAGGLLTGVAPGSVTVTGTDAALHASTTTGLIHIRGMGLTAGSGSTPLGLSVAIPITVTSLNGLGIRSGQFTLSWNGNMVASVAVSAPPGTLLDGWAVPNIGGTANQRTVDFAGATDLAGSGVLCYVTFTGSATISGNSGLTVSNALFNETMPAKTTNGGITVTALPPIFVNPDQVTLLAGQTQQMTASGPPTLPVTWSVEDPAIASISPTGLLTALHGGVTQVRAVDAIGSTDLNTFVRVYDLKATLGTVTTRPGTTVRVPLLADRDVGALGIVAEQLTVTWSGTGISAARITHSALWNLWGPGAIQWLAGANSITAAAAGTDPFNDSARELAMLEFDVSPLAVSGSNIPLVLSQYICNEGNPSPQLANGLIQVRNTVGVDSRDDLAFALGDGAPNPARAGCRIPFVIPAGAPGGSRVQLAIHGVDGRRVRTLAQGDFAAGRQSVQWDGLDDHGHGVDAGLYFVRLTHGGRTLSRKLAVVR